jgi:hypothetical protein
MNVHHLPEHGIRTADAASRATEGRGREEEAEAAAAAAAGVETGASARRRSSSRRGAAAPPPSIANDVGGKKDVALDSLFPPTEREIRDSTRHLSEAGARLVMEAVDGCARYCLRYSANARKRRRGDPYPHDGARAAAEGGRRREDDREKNLATLAEEIQSYFDMFQPDDDDDDDDDCQDEEDVEDSGASHHFATRARRRMDGSPMDRRDALRDLLLTEKYDPACLPMVCVKCYPNVLDRAKITESLASDLSRRVTARCEFATSRPPPSDLLRVVAEVASATASGSKEQNEFEGKSPCVCVVRSTSDLVRQGHAIAELLSQCISNDTRRGEDFASELRRQRKRMKSHHHGGANNGRLFKSIWSWTRSLVDWAGYTDMFNSIIVILEVSAVPLLQKRHHVIPPPCFYDAYLPPLTLEKTQLQHTSRTKDPEKIPSPTLDAFFTTLASLRSNDGVPICLVVIDATPGGLGDRLSRLRDPSLRGASGGVAARDLLVPLPEVQLGVLCNLNFSCG